MPVLGSIQIEGLKVALPETALATFFTTSSVVRPIAAAFLRSIVSWKAGASILLNRTSTAPAKAFIFSARACAMAIASC